MFRVNDIDFYLCNYMLKAYRCFSAIGEFKMGSFQRGRHAQAFILICLVDGPSYGLELKNRISKLIDNSEIDLSFLYRTLNKLEKEGCLTSHLGNESSGPVRKYYKLTPLGYERLEQFDEDIRERVKNLQAFLKKFDEFSKSKED